MMCSLSSTSSLDDLQACILPDSAGLVLGEQQEGAGAGHRDGDPAKVDGRRLGTRGHPTYRSYAGESAQVADGIDYREGRGSGAAGEKLTRYRPERADEAI